MRIIDLGRLKIKLPKKKKTTVDSFFESIYTDAFVVLHRGDIVYEQYWNGMNENTLHMWFSMSKSVVGLLAAIQIERGVLASDAKASKYIPELAGSGFADATIGQILYMTVGMEWDETSEALADSNWLASQYAAASGMVPGGELGKGVYDFLPSMKATHAHGEKFSYVAPNTDLAT